MQKITMLLPSGIRIGQQIFNFLQWLKTEKGYSSGIVSLEGRLEGTASSRMADPFYISDEEWNKLYWEFLSKDTTNA